MSTFGCSTRFRLVAVLSARLVTHAAHILPSGLLTLPVARPSIGISMERRINHIHQVVPVRAVHISFIFFIDLRKLKSCYSNPLYFPLVFHTTIPPSKIKPTPYCAKISHHDFPFLVSVFNLYLSVTKITYLTVYSNILGIKVLIQ